MARRLLIREAGPKGATNTKTILKNTILGATLIASSLALADNAKTATTTTTKTASKATANPLAGTNKPKTTSAAAAKLEAIHLDTFDDLDYNVFSGQDWANLHRSHHKEVTVHWPDGRETKGIDKHIDMYRAGKFAFDRLVRYYEFEDIERAFEDTKQGRTIKPILRISAVS